jgi:RNase P/RNase MRP subunit p29
VRQLRRLGIRNAVISASRNCVAALRAQGATVVVKHLAEVEAGP